VQYRFRSSMPRRFCIRDNPPIPIYPRSLSGSP
jgi:hypothetical protein